MMNNGKSSVLVEEQQTNEQKISDITHTANWQAES